MHNSARSRRRRELQVVGTFLLLLGAGLVLDRAAPTLGWVLALGATVLLLAAQWRLRVEVPASSQTAEPTGNQADTPPPSVSP